jgi:hypothetical protein
MKEIKKNAKIKSKVKGKETPFNIDLNYSEQYDSFNIKVKKGEGFMSYTDSLQSLPLEVVQKLNEMLEEVLIKAGSETEMKEYDNDYADIGQFSLPDSEWNKTEQQYIDLGKKIVNTKFKGDIGKAYDSVVRNKREFGGDFQAGVYAKGGSLESHGIKEGDTFIRTISGVIQKVRDKDGKIVYINLANGERDSQPPLPFNDGGEVTYFVNKDGIRVRSKVEPKKRLSEKEWMAKHSESKEARAYDDGGRIDKKILENVYEWYDIYKDGTFREHYNDFNNIEKVKEHIEERTGMKVLKIKEIEIGRNYPDNFSDPYYRDDYEFELVKGQPLRIERKYGRPNYSGNVAYTNAIEVKNFSQMYKRGGALIGNQKRIDMNRNGKIDAEDFKLLRSSMNGAWRNERKHVNHKEDYEVRYARKKPSRTGYKGKRNFETKPVEPKSQKAESGAVVKKKSGNPKMKEAMVLAKKIRKDGEKWTDAVKRAYAQIK